MSVFLIGGGREPEGVRAAHAPFLEAVHGDIVVLLFEEDGADPQRWVDYLDGRARVVMVGEQRPPVQQDLEGAGGLYVAGGWTPGYADTLRGFEVPAGLPYCGYSAGAAVAAARAVVGGWRHDGRAVCPEDAGEDLDAIDVRPGLGLVPFAVDVHAAQWGTLGRLVAAVGAGLVGEGYAIDEGTVLCVDGDDVTVAGTGAAWRVRPGAAGATVTRMTK